MDELGTLLREAREAQGLTLAQVQQELRINLRFLEALENGQYQVLPTPVHVRGYLRNYARLLKLDPQPLLDRYESLKDRYTPAVAAASTSSDTAGATATAAEGSPFFNPVNLELDPNGDGSRAESILRIVIIIALLVAIGLVASRFFVSDNRQFNVVETVKELFASADSTPEITLETLPEGFAPAVSSTESITSTGRNIANSLPTLTPTRPALPAVLDIIELELSITERNWIQVRIDGEVVYEGLARSGDQFIYTAQKEAYLKTANAIGVDVTINGIRLGRLGGRAEVVEETWRTNQ